MTVPSPSGRARRRVVFIGHSAELSGAELAMVRLIEALGDRVEPTVILGEAGPLVAHLADKGIATEVLPFPDRAQMARRAVRPGWASLVGAAASLRYSIRLRRSLRRLRPDLVHANTLKGAMVGGVAARLARVPMVWHVRDWIATDSFSPAAVTGVRLLARLLPRAIVANSAATLALLPSRTRIRVVIPSLVRGPAEPAALRPAVAVVGMVGRLTPWKGQDVFLNAFGLAFGDAPEVRAVLVGAALFHEEAYEASLVTLRRSLGLEDRVDLLGHRDDVEAELARIDVFVHASVEPEPFGQVIVEAMASGVPVIASAAGGPLEIITDGVDGLLVDPGDIAGLAAALRRLAEDPSLRRRLRLAGLERAKAYSPEVVAAATLDLYARCLGEG